MLTVKYIMLSIMLILGSGFHETAEECAWAAGEWPLHILMR
jgi:hypothetical protein